MDAWTLYQEAIRDVVRRQWAERRMIRRRLDVVEYSHRDPYTMRFLRQALVRGQWSGKMVVFAQRLSDQMDAEAMAS